MFLYGVNMTVTKTNCTTHALKLLWNIGWLLYMILLRVYILPSHMSSELESETLSNTFLLNRVQKLSPLGYPFGQPLIVLGSSYGA